MPEIDRRSFVAGAGLLLAASNKGLAVSLLATSLPTKKPTIGTRNSGISFQDDGIEKVLDILRILR